MCFTDRGVWDKWSLTVCTIKFQVVHSLAGFVSRLAVLILPMLGWQEQACLIGWVLTLSPLKSCYAEVLSKWFWCGGILIKRFIMNLMFPLFDERRRSRHPSWGRSRRSAQALGRGYQVRIVAQAARICCCDFLTPSSSTNGLPFSASPPPKPFRRYPEYHLPRFHPCSPPQTSALWIEACLILLGTPTDVVTPLHAIEF